MKLSKDSPLEGKYIGIFLLLSAPYYSKRFANFTQQRYRKKRGDKPPIRIEKLVN
jgi:hypothetical protein